MKTYDVADNVVAFSTLRRGDVDLGQSAAMPDIGYNGFNQWRNPSNRKLLAQRLGIDANRFVVPHQTHSNHVAHVSEPCQLEDVDAVFTTEKNLCVCVSTADCIPVLLYDERNGVVAAVHAGWRGTVARIVECTLECMQNECGTQGDDVKAVIGPGISLDAFEVGDEVYEAFRSAGFPMQQITRRDAKWHIDLWEANRLQLENCGVRRIELCGECTFTNHTRYYSARHDGIQSGRILNGIMLKS